MKLPTLTAILILTLSLAAHGAPRTPPPAATPTPTPEATPTADATPADAPAQPQPPMEGTVTAPTPAEDVTIAPVEPVESTPVAPAAFVPQLELPAPASGSVLELAPGWKLKLSGYARLNVVYVSDEMFSIDSPAYVIRKTPGAYNEHNSGLAFGARDSRLRFCLTGPKAWDFDPSAVIEVDFFGNLPNSGTSIVQGELRMRLAYAELKKGDLILRFGNDWMVAAPQFMTNFDPFNGWAQGNIWARVPQAKVLYNHHLDSHFRIETGFMVGQSLAGDNPRSTQLRNTGAGESSELPMVQARLGLGFKVGDADFSTLGVSGSFQRFNFRGSSLVPTQGEYDSLAALGHDTMDSWFVAVDGQLKWKLANAQFQLTGEYHIGQATGMFWGGILTSYQFTKVDNLVTDVTPTKSIGYFGDLKVTFPCGFWTFVGAGRNVVDEDDIVLENTPVTNTYVYGGVALNKGPMTFGLSGGYLRTEYIQVEDPSTGFTITGFTGITF